MFLNLSENSFLELQNESETETFFSNVIFLEIWVSLGLEHTLFINFPDHFQYVADYSISRETF